MKRYKTFPPRWSHIRVPVSSKAAARAAIGLYAPCTPKGYAVQRAAWLLVGALGPRALPGAAQPWQPPVPEDAWDRLSAAWGELVGPHDELAVYQRPQQTRSGFALLLLRAGRPVAFARLRQDASEGFAAEQRVLRALESTAPAGFWYPQALGITRADAWASLLTTALPPVIHRPVTSPDLEDLTAAISTALAGAVARPDGVPDHWRPMHGDFTPWNVRHVAGRIAVIDWEDAAWGPPEADLVLYTASAAAIGLGQARRRTHPTQQATRTGEAAQFWLSRLAQRAGGELDDAMGAALRTHLHRFATER